ncbi:histidine kinase [Guptibacillus hwajinpoensis]|uniref:histidine kinase n=1 Tax=Guptibacillus hwajinpoensis TaxID=208199 RepID=UPI001CFD109F
MNKSTLRWKLLKSILFTALFTGILYFLFIQISLFLQPGFVSLWFSLLSPLFVMLLVIVLGSYFSYKDTLSIRTRLEDISTQIITLSRGRFTEKMTFTEEDEIGRISFELNELADKLQKQVTSLQNLANQKADLAEKARSAAIIEERQRLARDLHDAVSQQLFALNMMASASIKMLDRDSDTAKSQMLDVADLASKAQVEMRALLLHLRPIHLSEDSLCEGIKKLVEELEKKSGVTFYLALDELPELPGGIEENLFRIVQESLGNALRHAEASEIRITVKLKKKQFLLHIKDNGKGFEMNPNKKGAYGLDSMQERSDEIGGQFRVSSRPDEGTLVEVRVPVEG